MDTCPYILSATSSVWRAGAGERALRAPSISLGLFSLPYGHDYFVCDALERISDAEIKAEGIER